ncbi:MAG: hypothetical protein H7A25_15805 [Leptospiraceae bacterium]|nr:hypothetical protein [Leptospiraceae bacterium]
MDNYYKNSQNKSLNSFVRDFPYDVYLKNISFINFKIIQNDRYFLYKKKGDGDIFLIHLANYFVINYPIKKNNISSMIDIGESYISDKNKIGINHKTNVIYSIIGYFILGKVGKFIEHTTKNLKDKELNNYTIHIDRLKKNRIYISLKKSSYLKAVDALKQKRYKYILVRTGQKIIEIIIKWKILLVSVLALLLIFYLYFNYLQGVTKKELIIKFSIIIILIIIIFFPFIILIEKGFFLKTMVEEKITFKSKYKLIHDSSHLKINNETRIHIFKIMNDTKKFVGHSIWMERPIIKAMYFAEGNVYKKLSELIKNKRNIFLATTGGFSNSLNQPEGFTVEDGKVVNALLMPDRHGLIIVEKNGGFRVINLQQFPL